MLNILSDCFSEWLCDFTWCDVLKFLHVLGNTWHSLSYHRHSVAVLLYACTQLGPTLRNPMDCSLLGSSAREIFQARILEVVAIFCSRDLPKPEIKTTSLVFPALMGEFFTHWATWETHCHPSGYKGVSYWESHFLGRLIRSPGSLRRRKWSGILKAEIGVWGSQGGGKDKHFFFSTFLNLSHIEQFFSLSPELMIIQQTTQFKLLNSVLGIIQQQCILLEDSFSFLKTFWLILIF